MAAAEGRQKRARRFHDDDGFGWLAGPRWKREGKQFLLRLDECPIVIRLDCCLHIAINYLLLRCWVLCCVSCCDALFSADQQLLASNAKRKAPREKLIPVRIVREEKLLRLLSQEEPFSRSSSRSFWGWKFRAQKNVLLAGCEVINGLFNEMKFLKPINLSARGPDYSLSSPVDDRLRLSKALAQS